MILHPRPQVADHCQRQGPRKSDHHSSRLQVVRCWSDSPQALHASWSLARRPHRRCGTDLIRCLDLRLAVVDSDGGPGDRGGDVRSCRREGTGCCLQRAPFQEGEKTLALRNALRVTRNRARTRANGARLNQLLCGTGTSVPVRTTFQESPRGAEYTRDTGDVLLSPAMARRVTPIPSGCHSPEPRAVRTTNQVADRCTSIAPNPHSRKHNSLPPEEVDRNSTRCGAVHHRRHSHYRSRHA